MAAGGLKGPSVNTTHSIVTVCTLPSTSIQPSRLDLRDRHLGLSGSIEPGDPPSHGEVVATRGTNTSPLPSILPVIASSIVAVVAVRSQVMSGP